MYLHELSESILGGKKPTQCTIAFCRFPAIGVYVFKRAQSAMQQPLLEAQAEV